MANRITGPMIAPSEPKPTTTSFKSKYVNMEKIITTENLVTFNIYELRMIMLILIQKGRKNKIEDAEENQTFEISLKKNPKLFTSPTAYYAAIKRFTEIGLFQKVEGKQSLYRVNPAIISNLTQDQSISLGLKKDYKQK